MTQNDDLLVGVKKWNQYLLLSGAIAFFGIVVLALVWRLSLDRQSQSDVPTTFDGQLANNAQPLRLQITKSILNQISRHTDSRGFYGNTQSCHRQENKFICQLLFDGQDDSGQSIASHRQTLGVAWARYQYWQATKDTSELVNLQSDLLHLQAILDSDDYVLQTNRYNCLLMQDLIHDSQLERQYRQIAADICQGADFEYYPDSDLSRDERPHTLFAISSDPYATYEYVVETDNDRIIPEEDKIIASDQQLISDIENLLTAYTHDEAITINDDTNYVFTRAFMTRELTAAMDLLAAYQLNIEIGNQETAGYLWHDYLLLTRETTRWWILHTGKNFGLSDDDNCLIAQNWEYFINNISQKLNHNTLTSVTDKLQSTASRGVSATCLIAQAYLHHKPIDHQIIIENLQATNRDYELDGWQAGVLAPNWDDESDDQSREYYFDVYTNALFAGLLSK